MRRRFRLLVTGAAFAVAVGLLGTIAMSASAGTTSSARVGTTSSARVAAAALRARAATSAHAATAISVRVSPPIIAYGGTAVLSARVTSKVADPSGMVTFADAKGTLCAVKLAKGAASCRRSFAALGTYRITARYGGDAKHARSSASASASAKLIVAQGETATTVTVSAAAAPAQAPTTFTATVATSDGNPTGSVVFAIGASELCAGTLAHGTARCRGSYPTPGKYTVTATYAGDKFFYGSYGQLSWAVTTIPTTLKVTASPAAIARGTAATLTAEVTPAAATGTVTFRQGATVICASVPLAGGSAGCVTPDLATLGTDQVTVAYGGTALYASSAGALTLTVVPAVTSVRACVNVGTRGKNANVGVTLTLVTPDGDTTAQTVGAHAFWFPGASNCPGTAWPGQQTWTLTFAHPVAATALTAAASYLQVASATRSAWHGQFELFTGARATPKAILITRPNMYYNQKSPADPCGYDESVNTYQFPLTTTPPGTCGTPTALNR